MLITEIINIKTIENIEKFKIDISEFNDIKILRKHIDSLRNIDYCRVNKEYYKVYMRERYREKIRVVKPLLPRVPILPRVPLVPRVKKQPKVVQELVV